MIRGLNLPYQVLQSSAGKTRVSLLPCPMQYQGFAEARSSGEALKQKMEVSKEWRTKEHMRISGPYVGKQCGHHCSKCCMKLEDSANALGRNGQDFILTGTLLYTYDYLNSMNCNVSHPEEQGPKVGERQKKQTIYICLHTLVCDLKSQNLLYINS